MLSFKKLITLVLNLVFRERKSQAKLEELTLDEFRLRATPLLHGREIENHLILFEYSDKIVRSAIWEMKFHKNRKALTIFASLIYDRLIEELSDMSMFSGFEKPLLIPIPVSKKAMRERGYNQCELLSKELESLDGKQNFEVKTNILVKTKEIEDQIGKSKKERVKNIKGCFSVVDNEILGGRNVIILDDVVTTGATMNEAKRVLKDAGVKNILCVAIAH